MAAKTYKSKFTGQQIDQRLEQVTQNNTNIVNLDKKVTELASQTVFLTEEEYDALEVKDDNKLYFILEN